LSVAAREALAQSPSIVYRTPQQRDDIVNLAGVKTQLVAFMRYLVDSGFFLEVTALKSDHHDDLELNPTPPHCGTHAGGWAIDCWPLTQSEEGAYLDAEDARFQFFLEVAKSGPWLYQIGLAGAADTQVNFLAAGEFYFADDGADHIHFGVHE
jgi:hypothetical protein